MLTAPIPQDPPPQTIHDVEHAPPEVTRAENIAAVRNALSRDGEPFPGSASELATRTKLPFIAVAEALQSLIALREVERCGCLRYQRVPGAV